MKTAKNHTKLIITALALLAVIIALVAALSGGNSLVFADETTTGGVATAAADAAEATGPSLTAIGAAIAIAVAALGGAIAMGIAIAKAMEGIARQPEADGKIRSVLMLGLVFIETLVIYALVVAILIMFVV